MEPMLRHGVTVTNPDRPLYVGISKRDLVRYYELVAEHMLPHVRRRPLTLVRCPQGATRKCFFQQHHAAGLPAAIRDVAIREADGEIEPHLFIENVAGLVGCVQIAALELHGWGARVGALDEPDRLVFDLDPDEGLDFAAVATAAQDLRRRLAEQRIESWPMLSGGKGIHVIVALARGHDWAQLSSFAERFAKDSAAAEPDTYVAAAAKAERAGRIFIDYLRNDRGATAVMPFSTRAKPAAPVAMPLAWDDLDRCEGGGVFTVTTILADGAPTPTGWAATPQRLPDG